MCFEIYAIIAQTGSVGGPAPALTYQFTNEKQMILTPSVFKILYYLPVNLQLKFIYFKTLSQDVV